LVAGFCVVGLTVVFVADASIAVTEKVAMTQPQPRSPPFYTDLRAWTANPDSEFAGEHVNLRVGAGMRSWHALLRPCALRVVTRNRSF
jgi:uncharacterized membrane protein